MYYNRHSKRAERLQENKIQAPLDIQKTTEWCNNFFIVPKANGTACLYLDCKQLNDILPKLTNTHYVTLIDASSGYHNLKHDKMSSYLTTFVCQFGRYIFTRLPF